MYASGRHLFRSGIEHHEVKALIVHNVGKDWRCEERLCLAAVGICSMTFPCLEASPTRALCASGLASVQPWTAMTSPSCQDTLRYLSCSFPSACYSTLQPRRVMHAPCMERAEPDMILREAWLGLRGHIIDTHRCA